MFGMGKMKVKVYFYHLFVLTVVMLLCFFLMYRDMKRIESNMLNLYQRCNNLDKMITSVPNVSAPSSTGTSNNMLDNIEKLEQEIENVYETDNYVTQDNNSNYDVVVNEDDDDDDNDGEENENNIVEIENIETEDNEDSNRVNNVEEDSENQENEVKDLLQKVIMVDDDADDVEDLLNSIDNEDKDLGTLGETELLSKTNNELKEYLKRTGKSTTGNKEQLVKNILGV
tara:strand:- start:1927 stop:2610 length:684 start_codon:yes stop_codon:yes gene_type:complete